MNLRTPVLLLLLSLATAAAHAQVGVYGMFTANRLGGFTCAAAPCGSTTGAQYFTGGTGGVYYDFRSFGPVRVGADVRGSITLGQKSATQYFSNNYRLNSVLGGVRASFHTPIPLLSPYVQGSVGLGKTNTLGTYTNQLQYGAYAGMDIHLLPMLDFRMVEVGIGGMSLGQSGSHSIESISSGVVLRIP